MPILACPPVDTALNQRRPWCIDEAVLRRFGLQYEVGLPGAQQRRQILLKYLERHEVESCALRRLGLLAPGEGGVDGALLEDRCAFLVDMCGCWVVGLGA